MDNSGKGGIRVVMLGEGSTPILLPLAHCIKAACPSIHLSILGLKETGSNIEIENGNGHGDFDHCMLSLSSGLRNVSGHKQKLSFSLLQNKAFNLINRVSGGILLRKAFQNFATRADLLHLHGMFLNESHYYLARRSPLPLVVSCWGSDVLRTSNLRTAAIQQKILRRASAITVTGPEFKEIVLSKYGRELEPKIYNTFFDPGVKAFASGNRERASQRFRIKWSIPDRSRIISIGHSGTPTNQHLKLLNSIRLTRESLNESLFFVVPMTYGASREYQEDVRAYMKEAGLQGIVFEAFLPDSEVLDMRLATDILIYAPVSDAFSGSVSQALAAGNVVILGSWLPYKARTRAGFNYYEIDAPSEAGAALVELVRNLPAAQQVCHQNRKRSAEFFDSVNLGRAWIAAYEGALNYACSNRV